VDHVKPSSARANTLRLPAYLSCLTVMIETCQ